MLWKPVLYQANVTSNDAYIYMCVCESWWRHQMETFSALLALCVGVHQSPVDSPHKEPVTRALLFSLMLALTNGWENSRVLVICWWWSFGVTVMMYEFIGYNSMFILSSHQKLIKQNHFVSVAINNQTIPFICWQYKCEMKAAKPLAKYLGRCLVAAVILCLSEKDDEGFSLWTQWWHRMT